MIRYLRLRNFAVYEDCELEFSSGLTIISGETGAGKTLLTKAFELLLGQQAKKTFLRPGTSYSLIELIIDSNDESLIISRRFSAQHSVIKINDEICTLKRLKVVIRNHVYLSAQHEQTHVFQSEKHIHFLDDFIGDSVKSRLLEFSHAYQKYKNKQVEIDQFKATHKMTLPEIEYLKFQIDDIYSQNFLNNEDHLLESQKQTVTHFEAHQQYLTATRECLSQCVDLLNTIVKRPLPKGITQADLPLQELSKTIIELDEMNGEISYRLSHLGNVDDVDIDDIESRLDTIFQYKAKYKQHNVSDLLSFLETLQQQLSTIQSKDTVLERLESELELIKHDCERQAEGIHNIRSQNQSSFCKRLKVILNDLDLPETNIVWAHSSVPIHPLGTDSYELLISFNKGFSPNPIQRVASGGELSRTLLGLKSLLNDHFHFPTMIFDEIDSGTGGMTANKIGDCLNDISNSTQIICISHQAQIASKASTHFKIIKQSGGEIATSNIYKLEGIAVQDELKRMIGGETIVNLIKPTYNNK